MTYTQVSAGGKHTVLLRSDGHAIACRENDYGQCDIPPLNPGLSYIYMSAGCFHTVLFQNDGQVVVCGSGIEGELKIPPLDEGTFYTWVSSGYEHAVLLRSDGCAVTCGWDCSGECDIPPLDGGTSYVQASAGLSHTVLLRSDGQACAVGENEAIAAIFHHWRKESHTSRSRRVTSTWCFSEMMAMPEDSTPQATACTLSPVESSLQDNVKFQPWRRE